MGKRWGPFSGQGGRPRVRTYLLRYVLASPIGLITTTLSKQIVLTIQPPTVALLPVLAAAASALLPGAKAAHAYRDLRMSPETRVVAASTYLQCPDRESERSGAGDVYMVYISQQPNVSIHIELVTVLGRFIIPLALCLYFAVNRKRMAREEAVRARGHCVYFDWLGSAVHQHALF